MSFFKKHPIVKNYPLAGKLYNFIDITQRKSIPQLYKTDESFFIKYTVKNGDSPHILADRVYDDPSKYWIIMMMNDLFDIDRDWPMSEVSVRSYAERIYDNVNAIHHYRSIATGAVVDSTHVSYDRIAVTNYEYEVEENDRKREIKILLPEFAGSF